MSQYHYSDDDEGSYALAEAMAEFDANATLTPEEMREFDETWRECEQETSDKDETSKNLRHDTATLTDARVAQKKMKSRIKKTIRKRFHRDPSRDYDEQFKRAHQYRSVQSNAIHEDLFSNA
jgi:hypothetical protein